MKYIVLILILLFTPLLHAKEAQTTEVNKELLELYQYLFDQGDIDVQLALPIYSLKSILKHDKEKFIKVLLSAINIESSPFTIYQADVVCHAFPELTQLCHQKKIHLIHQHIDPDNLFTYLLNLHANDEEKNLLIIQKASTALYSHSFTHENTMELTAYIKKFYEENPSYLEIEDINYDEIDKDTIDLYLQQLAAKGLVSKEAIKQQLTSQNPANLSVTMGLLMANVSPTFLSQLFKSCKNIHLYDACITVANLLKTDKSFANQSYGYSLLIDIYKDSQPELSQKITKQKQINYESLACYSNWQDAMMASMFNNKLAIKFIENFKNHGELEAFKKLDVEVYNIERKHGFNPNFNPKDCE